MAEPRLIVYSSLFPNSAAPVAGVFIKERMFRVGKTIPVVVIAPQAWSPIDWFVRLFRKSFRPMGAELEVMDGIEIHRPRWFSLPGVGKRFDGWLMAKGTERCVRRVHEKFRGTIIDAHFLYPDGWAATRIGVRLGLPVTITVRGSKDEWLIGTNREPRLVEAMRSATRLFCVSEALKRDVVARLGIDEFKATVVANGVDLAKFTRVDRREARQKLGIDQDRKVIIGVGGLIERKGFHRVIPLLAPLRAQFPDLLYLIVGGGSSQADMKRRLEGLAEQHGVSDAVRFCGPQAPEDLKFYYGAADAFVLATEHEGWANVFLEAMACGLPVITTNVGGNAEVVSSDAVGILVEWWDPEAFRDAIAHALQREWSSEAIVAHARANAWDARIQQLIEAFESIDVVSP